MSVYPPYKKSQDEMKLNFHNACLESSRKYRMLELSNSQKEFKRKYSWCLPRENTHNSNKNSRGGKSWSINKRNIDGVRYKNNSSSLDTNSSENQPCSPQSTTALSTFESDTRQRPSTFTATSTVSSACFESTSEARGDYPEVFNRRRTSILDVDTEDRIDYLRNLWNKVFPVDNSIFSYSKDVERRQNLASRDVFTSVVMNQFKYQGTGARSNKLPLIADRKQRAEPVISDTSKSKPKIVIQSFVDSDKDRENIFPGVSVGKDDMAEHEKGPSLCSSIELDDPSKDNTKDDSRQQATMQNAFSGNVRRKSMNIQLMKPPFQNFVGRSRSNSVDSSFAEGMWRSSIFNVLMRSTRRKRFQNCVMAAMNKGRVNSHHGRRWRAEMRKCRYLRLPDDSHLLSPVTSDSEPES